MQLWVKYTAALKKICYLVFALVTDQITFGRKHWF